MVTSAVIVIKPQKYIKIYVKYGTDPKNGARHDRINYLIKYSYIK